MNSISKFQFGLIGAFVVFLIGGLIAFATYKGGSTADQLPPVTIWGTLPDDTFAAFLQTYNATLPQPLQIIYVEKSESSISSEYTEALALGYGPDILLLPSDLVFLNEQKIVPIPAQSLSIRTVRDVFVPLAEQYSRPTGMIALPFAIDPMVMYWNRDTFTNLGLATYPRTWGEVQTLTPRFLVTDANRNLRKSLVSLGEYRNVNHARELLGLFFMQAGNPVYSLQGNEVMSALGGSQELSNITEDILAYYTQFANPVSSTYSWNRTSAPSKNSFIAGNLGLYFGFSSEVSEIRTKNFNLNFDVAPMPQIAGSGLRMTYGKLYGFSIARSSANPTGAFAVMMQLADYPAQQEWSKQTRLPPVRRDLIADGTQDPYLAIFYDSALISRGWIEPNSFGTNRAFQGLVESIISGRETSLTAIRQANDEMNVLTNRINIQNELSN